MTANDWHRCSSLCAPSDGWDRRSLSTQARISYDVFSMRKRQELDWLRPDMRSLTGVRPFNHFSGLHMEFPSLISSGGPLSYETAQDYAGALALLRTFPRVIDNAILRFREGMASGVVESRLTVDNMIGQIDALLAQDPTASPFVSATDEIPDSIPQDERLAIRQAYLTALRDEIFPAYRKLRAFLAGEYRPVARSVPGISDMKGGAALYREMIERETTLRLDPEKVHNLGLSEVARIRQDMNAVSRRLGWDGELRGFFDYVRSDPGFHPSSRRELIDGFAAIRTKVDRLLPLYFSQLPKTPASYRALSCISRKARTGRCLLPGPAGWIATGNLLFQYI